MGEKPVLEKPKEPSSNYLDLASCWVQFLNHAKTEMG